MRFFHCFWLSVALSLQLIFVVLSLLLLLCTYFYCFWILWLLVQYFWVRGFSRASGFSVLPTVAYSQLLLYFIYLCNCWIYGTFPAFTLFYLFKYSCLCFVVVFFCFCFFFTKFDCRGFFTASELCGFFTAFDFVAIPLLLIFIPPFHCFQFSVSYIAWGFYHSFVVFDSVAHSLLLIVVFY